MLGELGKKDSNKKGDIVNSKSRMEKEPTPAGPIFTRVSREKKKRMREKGVEE